MTRTNRALTVLALSLALTAGTAVALAGCEKINEILKASAGDGGGTARRRPPADTS